MSPAPDDTPPLWLVILTVLVLILLIGWMCAGGFHPYWDPTGNWLDPNNMASPLYD